MGGRTPTHTGSPCGCACRAAGSAARTGATCSSTAPPTSCRASRARCRATARRRRCSRTSTGTTATSSWSRPRTAWCMPSGGTGARPPAGPCAATRFRCIPAVQPSRAARCRLRQAAARSSPRRRSAISTATACRRAWPPTLRAAATRGRRVAGSPALVVDGSKVESVDPATHQVAFNEQAGESLMQGAIVSTPAVGDLTGDGRPEIVVGTNEEYSVDAPGEGGLNADNVEMRVLEQLAGATGVLDPAHSRVYALAADGSVLEGWPAKIGKLTAELLPIVGEGITGSPVIGPAECAGAGNAAVGAIPDAGLGYLLRSDGDSCLGSGADGKDRVVDTAPPAGLVQDTPAFPAVGHPAFGEFGGGVSFLAPAAGLRRALDAAVNEYQQGSQDFVGAWSTRDGRFRLGFPAVVNDLQFLTGPSVADLDGRAGQELIGGTASQDLYALGADGRPVSGAWPKLTSDWVVANPLIGSFGGSGRQGG